MIKVSSGTLDVLGLANSRLDAPPTTAYLMVGGRCGRDCGFCAQARSSRAPATALSRVTWPEWSEDEVFAALERAHADGRIHRCCLQVTVGPGSLDQVKVLVARLRDVIPLSVSLVANVSQVGELLDLGAERVGLSLDAVTEDIYRQVKGGELRISLAIIEEAASRFPGHITTHLMAGLGETEEEMVHMIGFLHNIGVTVGLFAFTPVRGTCMEDNSPPALSSYRRVQVARHLLFQGLTGLDDLYFSDQGQVVSFGVSHSELEGVLSDGEAFQTSGCPGCNRPYYNEPPRGPLFNYPRPLTSDEVSRALGDALS